MEALMEHRKMAEERRTAIGVTPDTRNRFNVLMAVLSAARRRRLNQDETLSWLLDRYEQEAKEGIDLKGQESKK